MKLASRIFGLLALLSVFSFAAQAQPALYVEGTHFITLDRPVRTANPDKIEVMEFFWYGCPHCYAFEPLVHNFETNLADDVTFVRSPAMFNQLYALHAQIFFTAQTLGVLDETHQATFDAYHQKGNRLTAEKDIMALFTDAGVSEEDFEKTWSSFGVNTALKNADSRMRAYGIDGVPALVVNGKYRITASSQQEMIAVANFLIEKERAAN